MAAFSSLYLPTTINQFPNPNSNPNPIFPLSHCPSPLFFRHRNLKLSAAASLKSHYQKQLDSPLPSGLPESLRQLTAASAVFFLGLGISICSAAAASTRIPAAPVSTRPTAVEEHRISDNDEMKEFGTMENLEDKDLKAAFEKRKSRTYDLTVPLRIVALRGSIPPSWVKDFIQSQGKRARLHLELRGSLNIIFSDLSKSFTEGNIGSKSAAAADIITVGDSWLSLAIRKGLIEALQGVEDHDWFRGLDDKWKKGRGGFMDGVDARYFDFSVGDVNLLEAWNRWWESSTAGDVGLSQSAILDGYRPGLSPQRRRLLIALLQQIK